ncbi:MAG: hypothetical protein K8R86_13185, partial [Bacteroidales bacterium]|nr:hypothetical protein [Bacteroidales bacterium]
MQKETEIQKFPPTWIFNIIKTFRVFLARLEKSLVPSSVAVFEKSQGFLISKAIGVACELNLGDILNSGPKNIKEIAAACNAHEQSLYRLMRALASEGIFKEHKKRVFSNTSMSKALSEGKGSMKYMIEHLMNETSWEIFGQLNYSVKTGKNAARRKLGMDIFEHLSKDKEKNELYNKAMTNTSALSSAAFLAAYDFRGLNKIVDIGGGQGYLLSIIMHKYKKLKGIVYDLPHVVSNAKVNFTNFEIENRAEAIPGDFFESIPAGCDAYIMKNILHAFDDDTSIKLLKSIHHAMVKNGRLLIMETVIGEDNKPAFGKMFDLQMLIGTDGGIERTQKEFEYILERAGFEFSRVIHTVSPFSIV